MNTANQLKQLADQHHYGTLEVDTLFAITEGVGRLATIEAGAGKYEVTVACTEGMGFNEYLPATTRNIHLVSKELQKKGYTTQVYMSGSADYFLLVSWAEASPKKGPPHPAIMNGRAPF